MTRPAFTDHLLASASLLAVGLVALPHVAAAQTEEQQVQAQQSNDQAKCGGIADPAQRANCINGNVTAVPPQAGAPSDQEIVVTGSRIPRPNFESLEPSVVVDSKQIESRGFETVGQALNEQPSFGIPGASPVGGQTGSFGSGQSFVNFLGLGSQRTLVLVNGRRFVSSNTSAIFGPTDAGLQVDLNSINTKLIDRVETIAIGGAPIYGSDAIAGTVNVILKRDYEGVNIDAQYGISDRGDAPNWRFRGIAGTNFADGRGNIVVSGEYNRSKGLLYNDRDVGRLFNFYDVCPPGSKYQQCLYSNRRIPSISESGIPTVGGDVFGLNFPLSPGQANLIFGDPTLNFGVNDAAGNQLQFDQNGNLIPIDFGTPVGGPDDFSINFSGGNGFNLNNTQQLLTNLERYNANIMFNYELTDHIRAFAEGWYAYSKGTNLREQPVYNSGLFDAAGTADGPIIMSVDNPFLTPAQRAAIISSINNNPLSDQNLGVVGTQDYFYLSRANTDIISGRASTATRTYRFVGGLDGTFGGLGGRDWNWEVVGNWGRAQTKGKEPSLVQQNFENAVNPVLDGSGNIVCPAGITNAPIQTLSDTCAPLNLFGSGRISQAALDYITTIANPQTTNKEWVVTASLSGPLVRLPGGDLSFALGAEHRYESTDFRPGPFFFGGPDPDPTTDANGDGDPTNDRVQFGRSVAIFPVKGNFHTNEGFGELRAEIVSPSNNIPFVRQLELHGAARYVDNSRAGSDWTWTTDARWSPIRDIAFRGNLTHAIRAPAITELFNPSSEFFQFADDPCDQHNLTAGPDPATRQANCAADGLPPNFASLSNQRSFHQALAGNVRLKNERSNAWSVGTILTPRFVPGLTVSADWLDIKLRDAITAFTGTQVVEACYDSTNFPNNDFCPLITRDSAGQLSFITTRYFNAAVFRYQGLLGAVDYRVATPFLGADSHVGVNASYQYLHMLIQKADASSEPTHLAGTLGYPRHSAVVNLNYDNDLFSIFTSVNYTGSVDQETDEPANFRQHERLKATTFVNGGINFIIGKRMTFHVLVDNIFDTKPPFPVPADGGAVTYFPGMLGRYFRFGASVGF